MFFVCIAKMQKKEPIVKNDMLKYMSLFMTYPESIGLGTGLSFIRPRNPMASVHLTDLLREYLKWNDDKELLKFF
jgi:hypothetical protein